MLLAVESARGGDLFCCCCGMGPGVRVIGVDTGEVFGGVMARNIAFVPLVSRLIRATRPSRVAGSRAAARPDTSSCPGRVARLRYFNRPDQHLANTDQAYIYRAPYQS